MAKELPSIKTNTDTFQSWITKTNDIIDTIKNEVLTANSSAGVTGSVLVPRNSTLFGTFTANTIVASNTFTVGLVSANATHLTIGSRVLANNTLGSAGQVLTSNGSGVYWSTVTSGGAGGVSSVGSGNGLTGGPITSSGSLSVNAQTGLIANSSGLYVNTAFVQSLIETSPPVISGDLNMGGNDIIDAGTIDTDFINVFGSTRSGTYLIGSSFGHSLLSIDSNTVGLRLNNATTGPTLRFNISSASNIRIIAPAALSISTGVIDRLTVQANGQVLANNLEVGSKIIPQIIQNTSATISPNEGSGGHYYKQPSATSAILLTIPDNTTEPCTVGTTFTVINDATSGNITLVQGGSTVLQLGGTFIIGNRTIAPGGFATVMKVGLNKYIVSGPGVS